MIADSSRRITRLQGLVGHVFRYFSQSAYAHKAGQPGVSDFAFGNPHDMPLPEFAQALGRSSVPHNKDWFAYKQSEPRAREVVAASLYKSRGLAFEPQDIFLTNGAFAALGVSLSAITDPGDEVIFISPPWFFYEVYIAASGAVPVRVKVDSSFDLDLEAIRAALSPRTRAIIINSPNNPTGKIYPPQTLEKLADLLSKASHTNGRTLYLISDEAYWRIRFDGRDYPSPVAFYPDSLLLYTYGKTLLAPGQRIGYIALPPSMSGREPLREALFTAQLLTGWAWPNALLQHALEDIEPLSIDIPRLEAKRDWMVAELRRMGYRVHSPEGTFYLLPRSPIPDDWAFTERLAEHDILCLPGEVVEMPGYFRISLTANEAMIERALPGFERAIQAG